MKTKQRETGCLGCIRTDANANMNLTVAGVKTQSGVGMRYVPIKDLEKVDSSCTEELIRSTGEALVVDARERMSLRQNMPDRGYVKETVLSRGEKLQKKK